MLGAVRLLDVDHDKVGVGVLPDGPHGNIGLIADERLDLILLRRLQFDIGESGEAWAQPFRNAEIVLGPPEADIVVYGTNCGVVAYWRGFFSVAPPALQAPFKQQGWKTDPFRSSGWVLFSGSAALTRGRARQPFQKSR